MANQLVEPSYLTQPLKVEVLVSISELKFIGLPREDALLGMDWFVLNKAMPDPEDYAIIFKNRKIFCDFQNKAEDEEFTINLAELEELGIEDSADLPWDEPERNITFNVDSADLRSHQKNLLLNLLKENKDVFASNLQKPCSIAVHQIILTEDNINPIRLNQYRK